MKFIAVQALNEVDRTFETGFVSTNGVRAILVAPQEPGCTSICWENNTRVIVKGTPDEVAALEATHEF